MKKIVLSLVTLLAAISCSSLMETDNVLKERQITFTTNIGEYATKATADGFEAGDEVGIIAMDPIAAINVKYTANGSRLTSDTPICWLEDQTDYTDFMAYYPYDPNFNIFEEYAYNISVEKDQRTHAAYSKSDFLVAQTEARPGETVALEFHHLLSRVDITIGGSLKGKVASVALSDVYTTINIGEGPVGEKGSILAAKAQDAAGEDVWSLILVPQESAPELVVTTTDGQQLTYPLGRSMRFESTCRYRATLSLKADGTLDAEFVFQVFDWLSGDWMYFETYRPKWSVVGNFTSWDWDYDMTKVSEGVYTVTLDLPEDAEFKFRKDYSWEEDYGAPFANDDGNFRAQVEAGKEIVLEAGGPNLYYPQGGYVTITLDLNRKTALIEPSHRNMILHGVNIDFQKDLEWKDGRYILEDAYVPDAAVLFLTDWNWNQYGFEAGSLNIDGYDVNPVSFDSSMRLIFGGPGLLYFETGGWMSFTWSPEEGLFTAARSENQNLTIGRILSGIPDKTTVSLANVAVYSVSEEGFVLSDDGQTGLYVYVGLGNPVPAVGDLVSINGVKQTYANQPEIADVTFEKTGETALKEVVYQDWQGARYSQSVPVSIEGQLYVRPFTSHEVIYIETNWGVLRAHYCFDEYLKNYGSHVKITGWYGGDAGRYGFISVDTIEGLEEYGHGKGTLEDPFDPVGAVLYARTLEPGTNAAEDVFVYGCVSEVVQQYSAETGRGSFLITLGGNSEIECYFAVSEAAFLENKPWEEGNSEIWRWDRVQVCGKLRVEEDGLSTMTVPSQAYLYSLNGMTSEVPVPYQYVGDGSLENPFTVTDAIHKAKAIGETASEESYYISGRVTNIREYFGSRYGNATFGLWDGNDYDQQLLAYRILYFGGQMWQEGQLNINDDDSVILYSPLVNYGGSTPEAVSGYVYSINGVTSAPGASSDFGCSWVLSGTAGTEIPLRLIASTQNEDSSAENFYALIHYEAGEKFQVVNTTTGEKWAPDYGISGIGSRTLTKDGNPFLLPYVGYFEAQLGVMDGYKYLEIHPLGEESPWFVSSEYWFDSVLATDSGPVLKVTEREFQAQEEIRLTYRWSYTFGAAQEGVTMQPGETYPLVQSENAFLIPETGTYDLLVNPADMTVGIVRSGLWPDVVTSVVSEAAVVEDGTVVKIENALVYAVSARGFVVWDGPSADKALHVYQGANPSVAVNVGDRVNILGRKVLYNNVPEINDAGLKVSVASSGNGLEAVSYADISATMDNYPGFSVPASVRGVLHVESPYYSIDTGLSTRLGSLFWSQADYSGYEGYTVRVNGFTAGYNDTYGDIVSTGIKVVDLPYENTIPEVLGGAEGAYYKVSGTVTSIANTRYGNFYITDADGNTLYIYGTRDEYDRYPYDGTNWSLAGLGVEVGKKVTVAGSKTVYKEVVELVDAVITYVGESDFALPEPEAAEGDGSLDYPFNVSGAMAYIAAGGTDKVAVRGIVSKVENYYTADYGHATFWISSDGEYHSSSSWDFEAYAINWLGNIPWVDGMDQIYKGAEVVLYGNVTLYNSITYETSARNAYVYSMDGKTYPGNFDFGNSSYDWDFSDESWLAEFSKYVSVGSSSTTLEFINDGLRIHGGGQSVSYRNSGNNYWVQPGGKGAVSSRCFQFVAPKDGKVSVWVTNTGSSEDLTRTVGVDQNGVLQELPGGYSSSADPVRIDFDVQAGSVVIYPVTNALRFFHIMFSAEGINDETGTTTEPAETETLVWDFSSSAWQEAFSKYGDVNTDITGWNLTENGLTIVSTAKSKYRADFFQFGGRGTVDDRYMRFEAPSAGTLSVLVSNTGGTEALDRTVNVWQENDLLEAPGGYSTSTPTQVDFEISAGEVKVYPGVNALRFYKLVFTPAQ